MISNTQIAIVIMVTFLSTSLGLFLILKALEGIKEEIKKLKSQGSPQ